MHPNGNNVARSLRSATPTPRRVILHVQPSEAASGSGGRVPVRLQVARACRIVSIGCRPRCVSVRKHGHQNGLRQSPPVALVRITGLPDQNRRANRPLAGVVVHRHLIPMRKRQQLTVVFLQPTRQTTRLTVRPFFNPRPIRRPSRHHRNLRYSVPAPFGQRPQCGNTLRNPLPNPHSHNAWYREWGHLTRSSGTAFGVFEVW